MMKNRLLILGMLVTTVTFADELPKAEFELIAELKQFCTEVAAEDGTDGKELDVFILECINEELDSEGYQLLTELN